jgi:hypothetical protein
MAKTATTAVTSVWNAVWPRPTNMTRKPKYTIMDQEGKIVATVIDQFLAQKWVTDHKRGAIRFVQDVQSPIV